MVDTARAAPLTTSTVLCDELAAIFGNNEAVAALQARLPTLPNEKARRHAVAETALGLEPAALCLSGGGIRSAAFALGIIQALARHELLTKFHYLSTVSGGGYIGSWLAAWRYWAESGDTVLAGLMGRGGDPEREATPIAHLREYSSYLTPRVGLFSGDTWATVAIYLRNLVLNWLVLLPALWLTVLAPKFVAALAQTARLGAVPDIATAIGGIVVCCLVFANVRYTTANLASDRGVRLFGASPAVSFLIADLAPLVVSAAVFAWLVNRPQQFVAWFADHGHGWDDDKWVVVMALIGAAVYALGYAPAFIRQCIRARKVTVRALRYGVPWIFAGAVVAALLWLGARFYVGMSDLITLVGAQCTVAAAQCSPATMSDPIILDAKTLLVIFGMPYFMFSVLMGQLTFVLLDNFQPRGDFEREWLGRAGGWYIAVALAWIIGSSIVLFAHPVGQALRLASIKVHLGLASIGGVSGIVSALLGGSANTPAQGPAGGWRSTLINIVVMTAATVFGVVVVLGMSTYFDTVVFGAPLQQSALYLYDREAGVGLSRYLVDWSHLWVGAGCLAVAWLFAGVMVNPNRFSLHAVYRNRLIRAFLGGPHADAVSPAHRRHPNGFTGFDREDDVRLAALWPPAPPEAGDCKWPFPVVNMALNVVDSGNLAWQQRKAEPFIATALACGSADRGYRPTAEYGGPAGGISLGTVMAISGAAISPNEGYNSSPLVTLLLTLFNVRLGWWLGNPGVAGRRTFRKAGPAVAFVPYFSELFGLTTDDRPYVYLSDGGHFENLGLYEMIRRRCSVMVISDAGQDGQYGFFDLGNAVRKVRIDLGVEIRISGLQRFLPPLPPDPKWQRAVFAIGTVHYPENPACVGRILYIKPGLRDDEPADVIAYGRSEPAFPHQPTSDQWFDEPQFESYRALGLATMNWLIERGGEDATLGSIIERLARSEPP
jgi:hypothetical protein